MAYTITNLLPKVLKYGLKNLRENAIFSKYINTDYSPQPSEKFRTVDVVVPTVMSAAGDVTAGTHPTQTATPSTVAIGLTNWKEVGFKLDAKTINEMDTKSFIAGQAGEALRQVTNAVDDSIITLRSTLYNFAGLAANTPDALGDITECNRRLDDSLAPDDPGTRTLVLSSRVNESLMSVTGLVQADAIGNAATMITGKMGQRMGFNIEKNQRLRTVQTPAVGTSNGAYLVDQADHAAGDTTVNIDTGTGTITAGSYFTVAGDSTTYRCAALVTPGGADSTLTYTPAAVVAWADDAAITEQAQAYIGGIAFHRDWVSLASRPVALTQNYPGVVIATEVDPISGLVLQLKNEYLGHWQEGWSWSILWGAAVTRVECGCVLLSAT
jgi:hypothetical protein